MIKFPITLRYVGLPLNWANPIELSVAKEQALVEGLKKVPEGYFPVYVSGEGNVLFHLYLSHFNKAITDFKGIDFIRYFDLRFKQNEDEESINLATSAKIIFIYNVGLEAALNTKFSAKLLLGLLEFYKKEGATVFVCSPLPYNEFYREYQIDFVNKIRLPEHKVKKIF